MRYCHWRKLWFKKKYGLKIYLYEFTIVLSNLYFIYRPSKNYLFCLKYSDSKQQLHHTEFYHHRFSMWICSMISGPHVPSLCSIQHLPLGGALVSECAHTLVTLEILDPKSFYSITEEKTSGKKIWTVTLLKHNQYIQTLCQSACSWSIIKGSFEQNYKEIKKE